MSCVDVEEAVDTLAMRRLQHSFLYSKAVNARVCALLSLKTGVLVTVVTVNDLKDVSLRSTKLAGQLAGLNVRRIINEPTAAALVYGFHEREAEKQLCVIDLGGGTFDVTVMEIFEGTLEIRATAGESHLGGEDFSNALTDFAV